MEKSEAEYLAKEDRLLKEAYRAGRTYVHDESPLPWEGNPEMQEKLDVAGWRYAMLIGLVGPDNEVASEAVRAEDKAQFGHFVKTSTMDDGTVLPAYHVEDAREFVHQITGYSLAVCHRWMQYDW